MMLHFGGDVNRSTAEKWPHLRRTAAWLAVAATAAVWAAVLVRFPGPAVTDPDGHASALYMERIAHGQRLEEPLLSTPKPLLTLTHGLAWTLTHDWRAVTLLTILAFGVAVTSLAAAARTVGGVPAALATLVAMAGSGPLILQVARGNSVVWALAGWGVALAALADRDHRRWPLAGAALLAAGLARTETWLLLPLVALFAWFAWRRGTRASCWLLLAFAAPVLWLAHDYLLTGDPLWSSRIPVRYTDLIAGRAVVPPTAWAAEVARRYAAQPFLLALSLAGAAWLATRRAWLALTATSAVAILVLTLLGWYAAQGVYISFRYFDPADLAVRLLAALGAAALATFATTATTRLLRPVPQQAPRRERAPAHLVDVTPAGRPTSAAPSPDVPGPEPAPQSVAARADRSSPMVPTAVASALACLAVAATTWPVAPVDPLVDSTLDRDTRLSANAATAIEALRPFAAAGQPITVSGPQRVRVALALDRPLGQVHDLFLDTLHTPLDQALSNSRAVYHDADGDRPPNRFAALTRATPGAVGPLRLHPIRTDPATGLYVFRIEKVEVPSPP